MPIKTEQALQGFTTRVEGRQDAGMVLADGGTLTWDTNVSRITGTDLRVIAASTISSATGGFTAAGVAVDDRLVITTGPNVGNYRITAVTNTTLTISGTFGTSPDAVNRSFRVVTSQLSWDGVLRLMVPGRGWYTCAAGNVKGVQQGAGSSPPYAVVASLDREAGTTFSLSSMRASSATLLADVGKILIAQRGEDDRLTFLGTSLVIDPGDSRAFGSILPASLDRGTDTGDGTTTVFDVGFTYLLGAEQLNVRVDGYSVARGNGWDETTETTITFDTAPANGAYLEFVSLAGRQGPSGPAGGETLQEAYEGGGTDAGSVIEVPASGNPVTVQATDTSQVVLQVGTPADPDKITLTAGGVLRVSKLQVTAGDGSLWEIYGHAGSLVIFNETSEHEIRIDTEGALRMREGGADPTGASGDGIRICTYEGSLEDENVTVISTGLTTIRWVGVSIQDADGKWWSMEMNNSGSNALRAVVTYTDDGDITISGDTSATLEPGESLQNNPYKITVMY